MLTEQGQRAYLESEILQADPLQLVRILYRAALESTGKARSALSAGDIRGRSRHITRSSEILNELALSVNVELGGEIARNLIELYDYMQRLLQEANFRQVQEPLDQLEGLLKTLLEGWDQCRPDQGSEVQSSATVAPVDFPTPGCQLAAQSLPVTVARVTEAPESNYSSRSFVA